MRRTQIVLLCEDAQHEAFGRRFLEQCGWRKQQIRVERSPKGETCGEQWVRERYPGEVDGLRRSHVARALVVLIDADKHTSRADQLEDSLRNHNLAERRDDEAIAILIPRRNIETWIHHLRGNAVDETTAYPHLTRERECIDAVKTLKARCDQGEPVVTSPPSLQQACLEWRNRIPSS